VGVVAIIPARGGSKGIPRKNLRLLAGEPLVAHAIRIAKLAKRVDRVVLSTDDAEIAAVGASAGAEVLMRPATLASDTAPTLPVLNHVLDWLVAQDWEAHAVVLLEPTSPFRSAAVIEACVSKLDDPRVQSVITVTQLERNPYNIFVVDGDRAQGFIREPRYHFSRRQQFAHLKRLNGCVYVARADLVRAGQLVAEPLRVVEMSSDESINIDTFLDLELAQLVASRLWVRQ
jgi:CMP-N,N'-diacetyllegionaminic acid synthase